MKDWHRFDTTLLPKEYGAFYEELINFWYDSEGKEKSFNKPKPFVRTEYLDDRRINARVKKEAEDKFVIGIHIALPCILHYYFNNLMRSPMLLDHLGDVKKEHFYSDFSLNGIPLSLPKDLAIEEAIPGIIGASRPKQDVRAEAASRLTQIAMSFCVYHELSHIEIGHVNALIDSNGSSFFLELGGGSLFEWRHRRIRRVWEYEADKIAAIMVVSDLLREQNSDAFYNSFQIDPRESPYEIMGLVTLAIYGVFHLFSQASQKSIMSSKVHPHPFVRIAAISEELISSMLEHKKNTFSDGERLRNTIFEGILVANSAWEDMGLSDSSNFKDPSSWKSVFKVVDRLESQRLKYNRKYRDKGWYYPFTSV